MGNDLALRNSNELSFDEMARAAKAMAQSGYFQDARDVSQAMVKIMAGSELGLGPFASMNGVHIIKGKPVLSANSIATLIKNDPRYDYKLAKDESGKILHDANQCVINFFENGEHVGVSGFTMNDAQTAGLLSNNTWKKYPKNMLFARALSNGARWYAAGVFGGSVVYTPDELGASVDENGEMVNVTPAYKSQPRKQQPIEVKVERERQVPPPNAKTAKYIDDDSGELLDEMPETTDAPTGVRPWISDNPDYVNPDHVNPALLEKIHKQGGRVYGNNWTAKKDEISAMYGVETSKEWPQKESLALFLEIKAMQPVN